ncbi:MAG: hypothetical protein P4M07_01920 [Xanthobacteraceae bacterium]|nr:hypothetical protein [Xanthobacteraceae bacterium]
MAIGKGQRQITRVVTLAQIDAFRSVSSRRCNHSCAFNLIPFGVVSTVRHRSMSCAATISRLASVMWAGRGIAGTRGREIRNELCRGLCSDATLGVRFERIVGSLEASLEIYRSRAQDCFYKEWPALNR